MYDAGVFTSGTLESLDYNSRRRTVQAAIQAKTTIICKPKFSTVVGGKEVQLEYSYAYLRRSLRR